MNILESIKMALGSVWANKLRAFLTMLGVIIGVSAVIVLLAMGQGVKKEVATQIEGIGTNIMGVLPGKAEAGTAHPLSLAALSNLTIEDKEAIKKEIPKADKVAGIMFINTLIEYEDKKLSLTAVGAEPDLKVVNVYELIKGRFFTQEESDNKKKIGLIGKKLSEELFGQTEPLGQKIKINKEEFEIVGIIKGKALSQLGVDIDSVVVIPLSSASILSETDRLMRIMIQVKDKNDITPVKSQIHQLLLKRHNENEDFSIVTLDDVIGAFDKVIELLTLLLSGIAAISLVVGGIGIMNIMLVSVTERTQEIGLRKAVGATNLAILTQFLIEAVVISVLGGAIGILFAYIGTWIIASKTVLAPEITTFAILLAFGVCVSVGIIFGIAPSLRASRLDPIKALRYE